MSDQSDCSTDLFGRACFAGFDTVFSNRKALPKRASQVGPRTTSTRNTGQSLAQLRLHECRSHLLHKSAEKGRCSQCAALVLFGGSHATSLTPIEPLLESCQDAVVVRDRAVSDLRLKHRFVERC